MIENLKNTVHLWDSLEFMKKLPDKCIDLILTDPPYGMNFISWHRNIKYKAIENDDNLDWLEDYIKEISRIIKNDWHCYLFCSMHFIDVFVLTIKKYLPYKNILIWEKNNTWMWDLEWDYAPKYEFCIYCSNWVRKLNNWRDPNIMKWNKTWNELHPTQKPVEMFVYLIEKSSNPWEIVLDCFAWSWTNWVACIETWRNYILIEKEEKYVEIINKRIKNTTPPLFII
jgi:site-specific DNA-methyltransferase (adenine-specific)